MRYPLKRKNKIILLSTVIGVLVLSAIFLPLTFFVFTKKPNLPTPDTPSIMITNSKFSAKVNDIKGAQGYLFRILTPNNTTVDIFSETPSIYREMTDSITGETLSEFSQAGEYRISCSAIAKDSSFNSSFSNTKIFERYIKLKKPTVNLYTENDISRIRWESVNNATVYDIQINSITQLKVFTFNPLQNIEIQDISLTDIFVDLNLPHGEYQIFVFAKNPDNPYYTQSFESNLIAFEYC